MQLTLNRFLPKKRHMISMLISYEVQFFHTMQFDLDHFSLDKNNTCCTQTVVSNVGFKNITFRNKQMFRMTQQNVEYIYSLLVHSLIKENSTLLLIKGDRRQRGPVARVPHLKSGDFEFKVRSDHQLDLFQVVSCLPPLLRL